MVDSLEHDVGYYVIQFTFLFSGVIVIVSTSFFMCKFILKLCRVQNTRTKINRDLYIQNGCAKQSNEKTFSKSICYQENQLLCNGYDGKVMHESISNKNKINLSFSESKCSRFNEKVVGFELTKLLLICCVFENIFIAINAVVVVQDEVFNSSASMSSEESIVINGLIAFRQNYISFFFSKMCYTSIAVTPVILYIIQHCFNSYFKRFHFFAVILSGFFTSKCFAFVLFPHFVITHHSDTFQNLLSSWIAFLSMVVGVKLNMSSVELSSVIKEQENIVLSDTIDSLEKKWEWSQAEIKHLKKNTKYRRRASLDVLKERSTIEEAVKWSALRRRRTSLPTILACTKKKTTMTAITIEYHTLVEIRFLLDEISKKPTNVVDLVKKIRVLLKPHPKATWLPKNSDQSDEEPLRSSPRHFPSKKSSTQRRFEVHGVRFSTTTTAAGLPVEEPGPIKSKRLPKISKDKLNPMSNLVESRCASPVEDTEQPKLTGRRLPNLSSSLPTGARIVHKKTISSDYESDDPSPIIVTPPTLSISTDTTTAPRCKSTIERYDSSKYQSPTIRNISAPAITHPPETDHPTTEDKIHLSLGKDNEHSGEGHLFFKNYQAGLLEGVYNWNFPIFEFAAKTDCILSQMAFKLFQNTGLFEAFRIPKDKFVNYMFALERGYREIPYHNQIHAADVLHGSWFLSTQEIPGYRDQSPLLSSDFSDSDSGTGNVNNRHVCNIGHGSLAQAIPALELLSLYLAAAMHDYAHPGKTNAFLVETRHPLATFYNDRAVLENHHAAASWDLLYSNKKFDFLENLDMSEWKRVRFLIIEAILATDLKKHFDFLTQFSMKVQQPLERSVSLEDSPTPVARRNHLNWSADEDRLLACQMIIKLADIAGPTKIRSLHVTWSKAICEEFFNQGDEERKLNIPVSPFMDRSQPNVAALQRTFINNLVSPIVVSMHKSGILAGEIPDDHQSVDDSQSSSDRNLLVEQLSDNLKFWQKETSLSGHEEMIEVFKFPRSSQEQAQPATSDVKHDQSQSSVTASLDDDVFDHAKKG